jgi:carbon-monoxide dehydrogenase medium subunit
MKPPPFSYHDPATVEEAVALLGSLDNAKLLAGGQSLMPMLNMRFVLPDNLIDLNRIDGLSYVRESDGALEIGAMTRQSDLEMSELIRLRAPLIREAVLQVGHRQTRNRGTIGGSLCHLDPAAELVTIAAAFDATVTAAGKVGTRDIAFADFPQGYMTPAVEPHELLTGIRLAIWPVGHGHAFVEFARRHGDFAIASAAVLLCEDQAGTITRASATLGGVAAAPLRMRVIEDALLGQRASADLFRAASESCRTIDALEDVHAPASYRQHIAAVLMRRALEQAHARIVAPTAPEPRGGMA